LEEEGRALAQAVVEDVLSGAVTPASPWSVLYKGLSKDLQRPLGSVLKMLCAP
jgi:hypothetical protein